MDPTKTPIATLALLTTALLVAGAPASAQDGAFDSGELAAGETFTWTPDQAGTYPYLCTYHPSMTATVNVTEGPAGDDVEVRIEGFAFEPGEVTVTTGTTITWTNLDSAPHTVTAEERRSPTEENSSMEEDDPSLGDGASNNGTGAAEEGADAPTLGAVALVAGIGLAARVRGRRGR